MCRFGFISFAILFHSALLAACGIEAAPPYLSSPSNAETTSASTGAPEGPESGSPPDPPAHSDNTIRMSKDILENAIPLDRLPPITHLIVYKKQRLLDLYADDARVRRYAIRLGQSPEGPKTQQGDRKTPEGEYLIDWRNPNSAFYKSLHISYPNAADRHQAHERAVNPGGDIMIHGLPNSMRSERNYHFLGDQDWTDGCIAVSNAAMDELWAVVKNGTPIQILP